MMIVIPFAFTFDIIPSIVYVTIGAIFILVAMSLTALILIAICVSIYKRSFFPRFTFFILTLFYKPLKRILGYFHVNPITVDEIGVALMNSIYRDAYAKTPLEKRILFLPQCLRHIECPAKISPREGIMCIECKRCGIAEVKKICDDKGIKICIAPGGEFVKRAIMDNKPEAAMGVACQTDLYETMRYVTAKGIPMVGVLLLRCGCVMTDVNWEEVKRNIF